MRNLEELIEKTKLTSDEKWLEFDNVMKESAKEDGIKKRDYNDYCLALSEDRRFWEVATAISLARLRKAVPLIQQEVWTKYRSGYLTSLSIEVEKAVKAERERISEIYIRYHDTIAPKDIRKLMLDGSVLKDWQALKGEAG